MKFLIFYFALCSAAAAAAMEAPPPTLAFWEKMLPPQLDFSSRDTLVQLATMFPRLYGFSFLCQFKSAAPNTNPAAVLPGEWLNAPAGGVLHCPDHYELTLEKDTRLRVLQAGSVPRFVLEHGQAVLSFGQAPFFFEGPAFRLDAIGRGLAQWLTIFADDKRALLGCGRGAVAMNFEFKETPLPKPILLSQNCLMELEINGSAIRRYVHSEDRVDAENLMLPHRFWPDLSAATRVQLAPDASPFVGIRISPGPSAPGAALTISWRSWGIDVGAICTIYGQKSEAEAISAISKFEIKAISGEFQLDPAFANGYVSVVCENAVSTLSSNVIPLQQHP